MGGELLVDHDITHMFGCDGMGLESGETQRDHEGSKSR